MQTKQTHWASLLTLILIGVSILFLLMLVAALALASFMDLFGETGDAASGMISAAAFGFILLLLVLSGWFVLQKTRGLEQADLPFKFPFAPWMWGVLPALVIFSVVFGGLVTLAELQWLNWIVLPLMTVLAIVPPIWLLFGIASNGLELGPRWQFFSIFSLGMTVGPIVMIVLEMMVLFTIIITGAVYVVSTQPALMSEIEQISEIINQGASEEVLLAMLTPYLTNPTLIAIGIGYIALIVPLIEELLKPLAVWLFARKIDSPAQGFALGVLSGAAFALVESLNAGADGSTSWAIVVSVRAGTSVLHMLTSGLVGWGIASAFKEKRIGRLFGAYIAAVLIHGVWNAAAAGTGLTALGESIGKPEWIFNFAPALVCGLLVMGIGVTALLVAFNRKLRKQAEATPIIEAPSPAIQVVEAQVETTEKPAE